MMHAQAVPARGRSRTVLASRRPRARKGLGFSCSSAAPSPQELGRFKVESMGTFPRSLAYLERTRRVVPLAFFPLCCSEMWDGILSLAYSTSVRGN